MKELDKPQQGKAMQQASIVIICAMVLWMAGSALGGYLGLAPRFAFLLDLACLAAFAWALVVLLRVWRARQSNGV